MYNFALYDKWYDKWYDKCENSGVINIILTHSEQWMVVFG